MIRDEGARAERSPAVSVWVGRFAREPGELTVKLFRAARGLGASAADAEDVAQATMERILKHGSSWRVDSDPDGYAIRVMHRLLLDDLRSSRAQRTVVTDFSTARTDAPDPDLGAEGLPHRLALHDLHAAIARLTPAVRAVVDLLLDPEWLDFKAVSQSEVATVLGVEPDRVPDRLRDARRQLTTLLPGYKEDIA